MTHFLGLVGVPVYYHYFGISGSEWLLFAVYLIASMLSVTMGYHRLYAHMTYKAHSFAQFLFLFFGAAAFQQSALKWSSQHRTHHQFVDTEKDPYNIKRGFSYAHMGWLMFWRFPNHFENVVDLEKNPLLVHQHRYYKLWAIGAGMVTPLIIGLLTGHLLGAALIAVCLRLALAYQFTFCINSVCHMFGKATYDIYSTAKDHWFAALLTFGEGYHNFHHHFPSDYRNGVRWYQWDPTKWLIQLMAAFGLAQNLKTISKFRIFSAKLRAEKQRVDDLLGSHPVTTLQGIRDSLLKNYDRLKDSLSKLEVNTYERRAAIAKGLAYPGEVLETQIEKFQEAKREFKRNLYIWKKVYSAALSMAAFQN